MGFSAIHWLIVLVPIVAVVIVVVALRRPRRNDLIAPPSVAARTDPSKASVMPAAPAVDLPEDVAMKVWVELRLGKIINAVKLVHESTDLDLAGSKALIEEMRRSDPIFAAPELYFYCGLMT